MASKEKDDYRDILFGYSCIPSCGWVGKDDGGFSVKVYADGRMVHKTYIFDCIVKTETEYKISKDSFAAIEMLMEKYQTDIDAFDEHLDNGSCDGAGNFFILNGKQIITWNIDYTDEDELKKNNPSYYEKYLSVVKQENEILVLFSKVAEILKSNGVDLKLYKVNFKHQANRKLGKKIFSFWGVLFRRNSP